MTVWRDVGKAFSQKKEHMQVLWGKKATDSCGEQKGSQLVGLVEWGKKGIDMMMESG